MICQDMAALSKRLIKFYMDRQLDNQKAQYIGASDMKKTSVFFLLCPKYQYLCIRVI